MKKKIKIVDESFSLVVGQETIKISNIITLQYVLHIPNLDDNLFSIGKLTKDLNHLAKFNPFYYCFLSSLIKKDDWGW